MEKPITNFTYNNLVLYAKGWYQTSDDIYDDIAYLLSEVYGWKSNDKDEIAMLTLKAVDNLYVLMDIKFDTAWTGRFNNSFASFLSAIQKEMNRNPDLSFNDACIKWTINIFRMLTIHEIKLNPPHYGENEHFKMGLYMGKPTTDWTYEQMNKFAQESFKD